MMPLIPGNTISHFKLIEKIGEGGMGEVYKAEDLRLSRTVAMKFILPNRVGADSAARLLREAQATAVLDHPNICTVYEADEVDGCHFIVMSYVAGQSLAEKIAGGPIPPARVADLASQVADALSVAHERGIVHRDIKPSNIMVTARGVAKVTDFGLAQVQGVDRLTRTGLIVGTPAYMAPEQLQGEAADHRVDIWALGVVIYEMVAGHLPFHSQQPQSLMYAIVHNEPEPLVAPELWQIVRRALSKEPAARYQHMNEMLADLRRLQSPVSPSTLSLSMPAVRKKVRPSVLALAGVAFAIILLAAWRSALQNDTPAVYEFAALTGDVGLSFQPALSRDGSLVAYSSDSFGAGNLDICVKQLGGGDPIRLTRDEADDYQPSISPDGTKIAFRSDRRPRGVYVVPTFGGNERLVAPEGYMPAFSPNGTMLAYRDGGRRLGNELFVVPSSGGEPRSVNLTFPAERPRYWHHPIWSSDDQFLLFATGTATDVDRWWLGPAAGGGAIDTGAAEILTRHQLSRAIPQAWSADGEWILFSAHFRNAVNRGLWRVRIGRGGQIEGAPERLTNGSGSEDQISTSATGRSVFASMTETINLWSLPLIPDEARVTGPLERLTHGRTAQGYPSLSSDGTRVVYLNNKSGRIDFITGANDIALYDLKTGKTIDVAASAVNERSPAISPDGSLVAYSVGERASGSLDSSREAIFIAWTPGTPAEKVCHDCGLPHHWSVDNRTLLYYMGYPTAIFAFDVAARRAVKLLADADMDLYAPQFSPDNRWIAFHARVGERRNIWVAPYRGPSSVAKHDWIPVTEQSGNDAIPRWAPGGNILYFLSDRDGFQCLWWQRLHPGTRRPSGQPQALHHFHHARLSPMNVPNPGMVDAVVARNRIVLALGEISGNVWTMERLAKPR